MPQDLLGTYVGPLLVAMIVVAAAAGASIGGATPGGEASDSSTEIRSCTKITEPGHYALANDIEGDGTPCLVIDSDGVTLDGKNYSVVQRDASSLAVRITGVNVTVHEVSVTGDVEYDTGEGSIVRTSASGGELFVDARRETTGDRTVVEKTVRVSDGSGVSSSNSSSSSVSVSSSSSSSSSSSLGASASALPNPNASLTTPGEVSLDDWTFSSVCGFRQNDERGK